MQLSTKIGIPLAAFALVAGGAATMLAFQTHAQTPTPTASGQNQNQQVQNFDPSKGGHIGQNGTKEELLTGDQASKAQSAALAAVPGGTVQRVETDAEGDAYEAHMLKADGTPTTVKFDSNFQVTTTEDGPQGGHRGGRMNDNDADDSQ